MILTYDDYTGDELVNWEATKRITDGRVTVVRTHCQNGGGK
jgi:hypothetical protein